MMNEGTTRFDELVSRYLDGDLSEQERTVLLQALTEREYAERFLEITKLNAEVAGLLSAPVPDSVMVELVMSDLRKEAQHAEQPLRLQMKPSEPSQSIRPVDFRTSTTPMRSRPRFGVLKWAAVFVGLLAVASICYVSFWRSSDAVNVTRIEGEVRFIGAASERQLQSSGAIGTGTLKTIGPSSAATLVLGDGIHIDVAGNSTLTMRPANESARLFLEKGSFDSQIAKQPKKRPLVFATADAEAIVIGTKLRLTVIGHATRLEVTEGEVRFRRLRDGAEVRVQAGQHALAAPNAPLVAAPLHPAPHH